MLDVQLTMNQHPFSYYDQQTKALKMSDQSPPSRPVCRHPGRDRIFASCPCEEGRHWNFEGDQCGVGLRD